MKLTKHILTILGILIVAFGMNIIMPTKTRTQQASAAQTSNVCPADTTEGAYHIQGYDDNGAAICGFTYYNACHYADGYAATDPMCDKLAEQQPSTPQSTSKPQSPGTPRNTNQCGDSK